MKLQTSLHNYFKKHPVLNNAVLWRKLHAGKQHSPRMALLFLLVAFISSPGPGFHNIAKNVSLSLWWEKQEHQQGSSENPWTSLAGVLIKSLLAIPWRRLVRVFPCHTPLASHVGSLCSSLPQRGLWTSLSLQSHIKALIEASFFCASQGEVQMCADVCRGLRCPKHKCSICLLSKLVMIKLGVVFTYTLFKVCPVLFEICLKLKQYFNFLPPKHLTLTLFWEFWRRLS